jgi:5-dehydro-2-deoxygluconokinase
MEQFLVADDRPFRLREDAHLEHVHWATTRSGRYDALAVLAVDHRSQFEDLAEELGADLARVPAFKRLAFEALDRVAAGDAGYGILLDGRFGFDSLAAAAERPYWIGRPIERPRSRPLEFEGAADVAVEIADWPLAHVVKVLVFHHPDDEAGLRERQMRQLARLFDACRATRHELLIEVIAPAGMPVDAGTAAASLEQIYQAGIRPDWWKLEPIDDVGAWRRIEDVIARHDPYCRGVLLLGLSQPLEALVAAFRTTAGVDVVKGFAVGRTVFHEPARAWLAGEIDDKAAVDALAANFTTLVDAWRAARAAVGRAA